MREPSFDFSFPSLRKGTPLLLSILNDKSRAVLTQPLAGVYRAGRGRNERGARRLGNEINKPRCSQQGLMAQGKLLQAEVRFYLLI